MANSRDEPEFELYMEPAQQAGAWANWVRVTHTSQEFTIDFARVDPFTPSEGVLVARVALRPFAASQLREALDAEWRWYAAEAMPEEIRDDDSAQEQS